MARRLVRAAFVILTLAFFVAQFANGAGRIAVDTAPGMGRIGGAVVLLVAGQVLVGEALVSLAAPGIGAGPARRAFHLTHPSKYIPAGVAQAAGLTIALRRAGLSTGSALATWALHTLAVVLGGVGAGLVVGGGAGWPMFWAVLGVATLLSFSRSLIVVVLTRVGRVVEAAQTVASTMPSQARLSACLAANAAGLVLHGVAFAVLIDGSAASAAIAIAAYALAHGLATATPLPGGLGAREALLFAFAASDDDITLTGVVLVRLLLMVVEAGFALASVQRSG